MIIIPFYYDNTTIHWHIVNNKESSHNNQSYLLGINAHNSLFIELLKFKRSVKWDYIILNFVRTTFKLLTEICTSFILIDTLHYTYKRAKGTSIQTSFKNCSCNILVGSRIYLKAWQIFCFQQQNVITLLLHQWMGGGVRYKTIVFIKVTKL